MSAVGIIVTLVLGILSTVVGGYLLHELIARLNLRKQRRQASAEAMNKAVENAVTAVEDLGKDLGKQQRARLDDVAYPVLVAVYELTDGNTGLYMDAHKIAKRADIPHTVYDFDSLIAHLLDERLMKEPRTNTYNLYGITPAGVRRVERNRAV